MGVSKNTKSVEFMQLRKYVNNKPAVFMAISEIGILSYFVNFTA